MIKIIGNLDLQSDTKLSLQNKEITELTISDHKYINYAGLWYHLSEPQNSSVIGTGTALINESDYGYTGVCSKEISNLLNAIKDLLK